MKKVVLDANTLVSALLSKPGSTMRQLLEDVLYGDVTPILSEPLIDEFFDVLSRPKFDRYGIKIADAIDFISALLELGIFVEITGTPRGCRDPEDDAVIETAEVGLAAYIITGDGDLHDEYVRVPLREAGIEVVTARDFLQGSLAEISESHFVKLARSIIVSSAVDVLIPILSSASEKPADDLFANVNERLAWHDAEINEIDRMIENRVDVAPRLAALRVEVAKTRVLAETLLADVKFKKPGSDPLG